MSLTLQEIAVEVGEWSRRNFGLQESKKTGEVLGSLAPLLGMFEEFGSDLEFEHFIFHLYFWREHEDEFI